LKSQEASAAAGISVAANTKGGAKAPPPKAAAKPTGKGAVNVESDKNAPKPIEIEY